MRLDGKAQLSADPSGPVANGSSQRGSSPTLFKNSTSSYANGSSANGESNGHTSVKAATIRPTGRFFGHDREEVTRILIQSLTDLGYHGAANTLSQESGYELENLSVAMFRNAIQEGEWGQAESLLFGSRPGDDISVSNVRMSSIDGEGLGRAKPENNMTSGAATGLPLAEGANKKEMLFLIRQQKYLELLEDRDLGAALTVLRHEITPLQQGTARLHSLSSLMMCPSAEELRRKAHWDGSDGESRNQLLSELSTSIAPSVMIPEHRLVALFKQVQQHQINDCLYHNTDSSLSLYHDHVCDRAEFPLEPLTELHDHTDEVWYVAFSPSGSHLATASSNNSIFIYSTDDWRLVTRLNEQPGIPEVYGVCYLAWSPDGTYLISCSLARQLTIYNIKEGGHRVQTLDTFQSPVASAVWLPDGGSFIVASHDAERSLVLYNLGESQPAHNFTHPSQSVRIMDCAISSDGSKLVAITYDQRILTYDLGSPRRPQLADFEMEEKLTCVDLSADGSQLLLSMRNSQLLLVDTVSGNILQHYDGMKQSQYVVRASFGGANQGFVVSGSEDSHIYIHRRHSGALVAAIPGHSNGTINSVAWHPTRPGLFASAGDDHKVKIWASAAEVERMGNIRADAARLRP